MKGKEVNKEEKNVNTCVLNERERLFQIATQLHLTLDWEQNKVNITNLLKDYDPEINIAIYWTHDGNSLYFSKRAEEVFGSYFSTLKRSDISQNRTLAPLDAIDDTYSMAITLNEQFLGMLGLIMAPNISLESAQKVINLLLPQLSIAKYATAMTEEVEKRTSTDKLTGLWNRIYFNERFREECERLKRSKEISSISILAVDDLAAMAKMMSNEEHNNILSQAGHTIRRITRQTDWVVNWNTHEILFYFPNTQPEAALEVFTRCMKNLMSTHPLLEPIVGLCSTAETTTARMLIQLASRRLDLARKEAIKDGRKRVVCYASKATGLQFWRPTYEE